MKITGFLLAPLMTLLFAVHTPFATADSDCVFDPAVFEKPPVLVTDSVSVSQWDETQLKAEGVFAEGGVFSVRYWACNHYGARAVMLVDEPSATSPSELHQLFVRLGSLMPDLEAREINKLSKSDTEPFAEEQGRVDIPVEGYSEFYLGWSLLPQGLVLEIAFYLD